MSVRRPRLAPAPPLEQLFCGDLLAVVTTPGEPVPQRIGDAERDRAVELLRDHMAEGRLDQAEFDERLTAALSAKTSGDLEPLFSDLPGPRPGTSVIPSGTQAPPWQQQNALSPTAQPAVPAVPEQKWDKALLIATSIAWPVTLLVLFATSWSYWWLIFIPIIISSMAGNNRHQRGHHRDRDRDRRRSIDP